MLTDWHIDIDTLTLTGGHIDRSTCWHIDRLLWQCIDTLTMTDQHIDIDRFVCRCIDTLTDFSVNMFTWTGRHNVLTNKCQCQRVNALTKFSVNVNVSMHWQNFLSMSTCQCIDNIFVNVNMSMHWQISLSMWTCQCIDNLVCQCQCVN